MDMGEAEQAMADAQRAEEIFARLATQYPDDRSHRANVAVSRGQQAQALRELDQFAEAERAFRDTLAIRERLSAEFPDVPVYRRELGSTLQRLATLLKERGDAAQSMTVLQRSLDVSRRLVAEDPDNPDYLSLLAGNHGNMGNGLSDMGQWEQ